MKQLVLVLAVFLAAASVRAQVPGSFNSAIEAYNAGQHESARQAFSRMARDGRADAQFNLAAMLANGQGGTSNLAEAVLWMTLSSEAGFESAEEALEVLTGMLRDDQQQAVDQKLPQWRDDYSRAALYARHAPELCADCEVEDIETSGRSRHKLSRLVRDGQLRIDRKPPRYPREAASNRTIGTVEMGAWLTEQGTLELPHILFSDPADTFDTNALKALKRWEFEWQVPPGERSGFYFIQTIDFRLNDLQDNYRLERRLRHDLGTGLESAHQNAFPAYIAANTLDFIGLEVDPGEPTRLVEIAALAARQGAVRAQLDIANRLRCGDRVHTDPEASVFWLKQAAYAGDHRAQFYLSLKEERLGKAVAEDFAAEAEAAGYAPALLAAIREQIQSEDEPDPRRLSELLEALPDSWRRHNKNAPCSSRRSP